MAVKWKEGDKVRIIEREVTAEDRKSNRYFDHMQGLEGVIQNIYGPEEVAVKIDLSKLPATPTAVHKEAVKRMREKFLSNISEEQKGKLTSEELNFSAHYMLLVRSEDLEKA